MGFRSYIREFLVAILMLFRPSGPCCLGVAEAPFLSLESWKTATFLVGSESNVRPLGPLPAGPVRPLGPCCLGVAEAPFLSLETHVSHPGAVF